MSALNIARCVTLRASIHFSDLTLQAFRQRKLAEAGAPMGYGGTEY